MQVYPSAPHMIASQQRYHVAQRGGYLPIWEDPSDLGEHAPLWCQGYVPLM
jgi:hypothetical protein